MVFSDVEEAVKRSQEPMYNVLTVNGIGNAGVQNEGASTSKGIGEICGGTKKVRHVFKKPTEHADIVQLSHKNFAPKSKKKMRWAVNLFCDWRVSRLSNVQVPIQIIRANLDDLYNVTQEDLCYALSCFIGEIKKNGW